MDKEDIRRRTLEKRDQLSKEEIEEKSRQILEKIVNLEEYKSAENVLIYASMRSEVVTDDIILDCLANGKNVFCPKVTDKERGIMEFVRITSLEELSEGFYGIREPELSEEKLFSQEMDIDKSLVIMPGAAFDKGRNRVGYGGGYYDRYLKRFPGLDTAAVCFDLQISDERIDVDENDVRPLAVVSEARELLQ
jgi:5-formyltetrahydrofolate cyclo-ligase